VKKMNALKHPPFFSLFPLREGPERVSRVAAGVAALLCILVIAGCAWTRGERRQYYDTGEKKVLPMLGYTIQVGAFAGVDNASRLTDLLNGRGLEAYYYKSDTGLYRVRFGNYATKEMALKEAERLKSQGTIDVYYVVRPEDYPAAPGRHLTEGDLRGQIVQTAHTFMGVPYRWGGESPDEGFDCSGLAMAVYRLNGLDLPRTSEEQFNEGTVIPRRSLSVGDLVFFKTKRGARVSHVGIYIGSDTFIHAPSQGAHVRTDSLSDGYYDEHYAGARSYL